MIIPYSGSKLQKARDLVSFFPPSFREYRDPFAGSGAMLWEVPNVTRWVNDANPDIVALLRAVKSKDFEKRVRREIAKLTDMDARYRAHVLSCIGWYFEDDQVDHAIARGTSYGRMVSRHRGDIASFSRETRDLPRNLRGWTPETMQALRDVMRGVKITPYDYSVLLDAPGDDVIIFCDPPYYYPQHGQPIYDYDLSADEHRELERRLRRCKHRWVLTVNICGLTCELYEESGRYNVYRMPYRYSSFNRGTQSLTYEYVVCNF